MALLVAHRAGAAAHDVVYVIVDDTTAKGMNLSVGSAFIQPTFDNFNTHFIVAAIVHAILGVYSDSEDFGLLLDYHSYATSCAKDSAGRTLPPHSASPQTPGR